MDSFSWTPNSTTGIGAIMSSSKKDSVRIRVKSSNGKTRDMSGWFFSLFVKSSSIDPENNSNQIFFKGLTEE